jgi:hypothetical protein
MDCHAIIKWKNIPRFDLALPTLMTMFYFLVIWFVEIVLVALIHPVPLFGQHASFAAAMASDSADECVLVALTLSTFDDSLCATESHRVACEFLQIVAKTRRGALKDYRSVIEKMLLWCLLIKKKSIFDVDNPDLAEFISFMEAPPESWVAIPGRRFIHSRKDVAVNYLWRPFRYARNSSKWCRPLVNYFLSTMRSYFQEGIGIPKSMPLKKKSVAPSLATLEAEAAEYLKFISSYTSVRGRHEKQLFVFVCAYYLRISLSEFARLATYIHMDDFSSLSNGQWAVSVNSPEGCIFANLPSEFSVFFNRYRAHLGLPVASITNEHATLFSYKGWDGQPDSNTIYDWGMRLPQVSTLGVSAPKLLSWLSNAYGNIQRQQERVNYDRNKAQKDKLYFERAYRTIKQFGTLEEFMEVEKGFLYFSCCPMPFFKFPLRFEKIKSCIDLDSLFNVLGQYIKLGAHEEFVIAISNYIKFSSAMESGTSYLRSVAYEKFLLWSLLIKKIPPSQMLECDTIEFYFFCASPPASWVSNKRVRRFVKALNSSALDPNPEWKPFFIELDADRDMSFVRAARIISWCKSTQDWLVSNNLIDKNIFNSLAAHLWQNGKAVQH